MRKEHHRRPALSLVFALVFCLLGGGSLRLAAQERGRGSELPEEFRIITERNVFDKERRPNAPRPVSTPRPASTPAPQIRSLNLVGTMVSEDAALAFFDGALAEKNVARIGDSLSGLELVRVGANSALLKSGEDSFELPIGQGLRRYDSGSWQLGEAIRSSSTSPYESAYRPSGPASSSSFTRPSTSGGTPSPAAGATSAAEMLRQLRERRMREEQREQEASKPQEDDKKQNESDEIQSAPEEAQDAETHQEAEQ